MILSLAYRSKLGSATVYAGGRNETWTVASTVLIARRQKKECPTRRSTGSLTLPVNSGLGLLIMDTRNNRIECEKRFPALDDTWTHWWIEGDG